MSLYFVGVDAQVDFIDGALPNERAQNNVASLNQAMLDARTAGADIVWTQDTHGTMSQYAKTLEGQKLKVHHCEKDSEGWQLHRMVEAEYGDLYFEKETFGSIDLLNHMVIDNECESIDAIFMGGYCTNICGVSNALLLRAGLPNVPIYWLAFASAATSDEDQEAAIRVMESCQIDVIHSYDKYAKVLEAYTPTLE